MISGKTTTTPATTTSTTTTTTMKTTVLPANPRNPRGEISDPVQSTEESSHITKPENILTNSNYTLETETTMEEEEYGSSQDS